MRTACVVMLVVALGSIAARTATAASASPLRVTIDCESSGRTKACPAFLLGFVDAHKVLLASPRSAAEVIVYASTSEVALIDRVHLRFVGKLVGAPPVVELDVDLDSRTTDDAQRAQLEPAFLRGIALFVATRHPGSVTVALSAPAATDIARPTTTPWGASLVLGGFANYTKQFQSYNGFSELSVSRLERTSRLDVSVFGNGGLNRQPPLAVDDGMGNTVEVSLDTNQWSLGTTAKAVWLANHCWSVGSSTRAWRDDPKGQFRYGWNAKAGVEWDKYQADDPRGNRLALLYVVGYQAERYNLRNDIGERFAHYPIHALIASGAVRKDKIGIGVSLSISGEVLHPERRHSISAAPFIEWKLGNHVDLELQFFITERQLPGPDPAEIDPTDYAQSSRLSFAEPFAMNGSASLSIHWDRTNGARNDRLSDL
ncbi:MAG: hypothetical protein H6Q90_2463 [Deltaproteobacteria bacterium]|nr:hypothetical protein [Deltaproteobacteria bacterium]